MPTYDYVCEKCQKSFEIFQSMSADRLTDCPEADCDGKVKRLIGTGAGLLFKGSGFYITDYRSDSYKAGAKSEGGKSESSKSETKSTESKPAAKESKSASPAIPNPKPSSSS